MFITIRGQSPRSRTTYLVKNSFLWTNETPLECLFRAVVEVDGQAHVEDLAVVVRVCVVAVGARVAAEGGVDALPDGRGVAGQSEVVRGHLPSYLQSPPCQLSN